MFKITEKWLNQHRTQRGAWTNAQWLALGLTRTELRAGGWKRKIIGKEITEEQKLNFENAKNQYSKNTRDPKIKANSDLNKLIVAKIKLGHHRRLLALCNNNHKQARELLSDIIENALVEIEETETSIAIEGTVKQ